MRKALDRRPELIFYAAGLYFLLCIALRLARSASLEIDESEQAYISQYLLFGYGGQPPFYNWLQWGVAQVIGMSVLSLSLVKNGLMLLACLLFGFGVRRATEGAGATGTAGPIALLGILTLPPVFLLMQRDLSHTAAALFAVGLFVYAFLCCLRRPSLFFYALAGLAIGIGIISKYNFVVLPLAAILAALAEPAFRARILDWRVAVTALVALVVVAPHALWLLAHFGQASGGTLAEMREGADRSSLPAFVDGTLALAGAALSGMAPTAAVFFLVFFREARAILSASSPWSRLFGRMLIFSLAILWFIVLAVGATHVREKWLILVLVLFPIYLTLKVEAAGIEARLRLPALALIVAILALGSAVMLLVNANLAPLLGRYSRAHMPYDAFAARLTAEHGRPAMILARHGMLAGNLRLVFPGVPVAIPDFPPDAAPSRESLAFPLLIVWDEDCRDPAPVPPSIAGLVPGLTEGRTLALPYKGGKPGDEYCFSYSWLAEAAMAK